MDLELHLPWENDALEALLLKIIKTGETTKIDFKRQLNISTAEDQAELLKDISALANTYDQPYRNHGFILLGVVGNNLTYTTFSKTADALQADIDQIIRTNVEPFIPTHLRIFGSNQQTWGVIVVPPTRTAPHVFVRDLPKKCRGDIFVRRGTTTEKALPADYVRFFRLHLDEHTYELRDQLEDVKRELSAVKRKLATVKNRAPKTESRSASTNSVQVQSVQPQPSTVGVEPKDLLGAIETALAREEDPIAKGLLSEARNVQKFLNLDKIPWALNHIDKEISKKVLDEIEKEVSLFWNALGTLVYRDVHGKYDEAVVRALTSLLQIPEPPMGTPFTDWGTNIRYLPLVVSLYIVFTVAASTGRYGLLKKLKALSFSSRSRYEELTPLPYVLFYIRRADPVFQALHPGYPQQSWCDPIGTYIDMILQRQMNIEDPLWDRKAAIFIGEFLLCLTPVDVIDPETKTPAIGHPSAGTYLYHSEAVPVIKRFLKKEAKSIATVFDRPLQDVLSDFDKTAQKLVSGLCFGSGFVNGALSAAYPAISTAGKS